MVVKIFNTMKSHKMENWQTKKLGEVCNISIGKTPARGNKKFWDTEKETTNIWLSIRDLNNTNKKEVFDSREYISDSGAKLCKKVKQGILLASFKLTLGRLAFAGIDLYTNEAIAALEIKSGKELKKEYLYYYLTFFDWHAETKGDVKVKGKTLNKAKLKKIKVFIPSLAEQKRIVKILDGAFAKIETAKKNAEKNLQNSKELFESYLQSVFVKGGEGWEEKRLGDKSLLQIIDGDRGKNYPKKSDFLQNGHCLFLNTKNVRPNGFDFQTTMFVTKNKDEALGNGKLERNDVLLTTRGTIGNIAVYDKNVSFENIRINSGMLIFRPNVRLILPEYLFAIFQSGIMKTQIKKYVSGAAQPQLPIKTLVNFSIPVPKSLTTQKQIVAKLDALSKQTKKLEKNYQQKIDDLDELKKSVLQKAFNGEL